MHRRVNVDIVASASQITMSASKPAAIAPLRLSSPASRAGASASQRARSSSVKPRRRASVQTTGRRNCKRRDAAPRLQKIARLSPLHLRRAGRVVGDYHVDHAIAERVPQQFAVLALANRRAALELRRAVGDLFSDERKIVRARLRRDRQAIALRLPQSSGSASADE